MPNPDAGKLARFTRDNLELISASKSEITDEMLKVAEELARIHGKIRVSREARGIHLYFSSPACLEQDGAVELSKLHLAFNVEKYLSDAEDADNCALCMKTSTPYRAVDLMSCQTLKARGFEAASEVVRSTDELFLELDAMGNQVPKGPGVVTPIFKLPRNHPAREYLENRPGGPYCPFKLYQQFELSWCEEERKDVFYKKGAGGFRTTSQGRLIFFVKMYGLQKSWQARILERDHNGFRYYWHPYQKSWVKVLRYNSEASKWLPMDERWEGFDPVKYWTAPGSHRNECLLGFDAAVAYTKRHRQRHCVIAEGPMDVGRTGAPGMSLMGKSLSTAQLALLLNHWEKIIYIPDLDTAGVKARDRNFKLAESYGCSDRLVVAELPGGKDLGELDENTALSFIDSFL